MALPTAPLGQLPNLNMPYAIPTIEVRRGRDQVLTALAATIASTLGQQVVENAMSRDYAETAGVGDNAGFWSKLTQGPKMNKQQFEQANQRRAVESQAELDRTLRSNIANTEADLANRRIDAQTAEGARGRELEREMNNARLEAARTQWLGDSQLRRDLSTAENQNRLETVDRQGKWAMKQATSRDAMQAQQQMTQLQKEFENAMALTYAKALAEADTPQGRYYDAQAAQARAGAEIVQRQLGGQPARGADEIDSRIKQQMSVTAPKQPPTTPAPIPTQSYTSSLMDLIQQGLSDEQIAEVQKRQGAVQDRAAAMEVRDAASDPVALSEAAKVAELQRFLKLAGPDEYNRTVPYHIQQRYGVQPDFTNPAFRK